MKPKLITLIRLLAKQSEPITASTLSSYMEVSLRSVKNYIQEINAQYPDTIHSSRKGYCINTKTAKELLEHSNTNIPQTSRERCTYILNSLFRNQIPVDAYELCDEMYISYSTLVVELQAVKRKLSEYDLLLFNSNGALHVEGLEKNKRKLLSSILYQESNVNFVNLKVIQDNFLDIDTGYIKTCLLETFHKYHYFVNDYSLVNLIVHITIAIDRMRNNIIHTQNLNDITYIRTDDFSLAKEISEKIGQHFHITYNDDEIYELALLLISRGSAINYKTIDSENLIHLIGSDCFGLVLELIQSVNSFYYIDLTEPEFLIRFALHIKNLLLRSKSNYLSKNPLTEEIKSSCPLIYDASVCMSGIIKEKIGVSINDDEIAYIAFHLGSALEAQKNLNAKITAILYCPNYYDMNLKLSDMINTQFQDDILITNIVTDESELENYTNSNLIISTLPVSTLFAIPCIQISIFLTEKDSYQLRKKVEEIKLEKKRAKFQTYLETLIIPDFFELNSSFSTENEVIDYMADKMYRFGYVTKNFRNEVYEREKMSSTGFPNFALPHAMKMYAIKTGLHILISENPISWGQNQVHLVIMLCFNVNERHIFNEIFDPLTMIIGDKDNMKHILKCKTYTEFIQTLTGYIQLP